MAYNLARRKIDDAASLLTVSLTEKLADLGYIWRIDTGYKALAANGNYASIHFHYTIKMLAKGALTFAAHVAMGIYPIRDSED